MIAIIDYGVGNLFSLKSSLNLLGIDSIVTSNIEEILKADKVILPGVGAFRDAIMKLKEKGLDKTIYECVKLSKPILGICLGMQLLFTKSYEYGVHEGLNLIEGEVVPIEEYVSKDLKVPEMGWNKLKFNKNSKLFKYISDGDYVYFVHSYFAKTNSENVSSYTDYEIDITASVEKGNVYGCQFHPEKSGEVGLKILKAFSEV